MADNRINIFKNPRGGGKYPEWKGFVSLDGKVYEVAMWPAKNGKPDSYSGTIQPKREDTQRTQPQTQQQPSKPYYNDLDDEIPF